MSITFYNKSTDRKWLLETHLKDQDLPIPPFRSFVLYGNEDCPEKILLFYRPIPNWGTKPAAEYQLYVQTTISTYIIVEKK